MPNPGIALPICPGDLADVIRVLRAGLDAEDLSETLRENLSGWCDEMEAFGADVEEEPAVLTPKPLRVGIDIGGVISKYPDVFLPLLGGVLPSGGIEVHVVTDMPLEKAQAMLALNGVELPPDRLHSCDYEALGDACKAEKAWEIGLDVLVDDHHPYVAVAVPGATIRLLVMPDGARDYYHPTWKTDGTEGRFGRRLQRRA